MEKKYMIHNILMLFSLGLLLILHYFILFMEEEKGEVCGEPPGGTGRLPCRKAFFQSPSGGTAL